MRKSIGRIALTAGLLAALGAGGAWAWRSLGSTEVVLQAATAEVVQGPFQSDIFSIGTLSASRSARVAAPFEGRLIRLLPEGTRVAAGDPIAWFETEDFEDRLEEDMADLDLRLKDLEAARQAYELEVEQNNYSVESERVRVEIARQRFLDAQRRYDSEASLFERQIVPRNRVDEARLSLLQAELNWKNAQINLAKVQENLESNLRVRQREIDRAQLNVQAVERRIRENEDRIESAVVRAPAPGDISYLQIWKSGTVGKVAEGDTIHRMSNIIEIPDPSVMLALVPVNEIDVSRVEPGQRAEVRLDALPGRSFGGVVEGRSVVPITDPTQRSWGGGDASGGGPREFEVRIRLDDASDDFRQGMTAAVRIIVDETDDALHAPIEALDMEGGLAGVWRQQGYTAEFVPVQVLMTNDNFAALSGDLAPGDRVLLSRPDGEAPRRPPAARPAIAPTESPEDAAPAAPAGGGDFVRPARPS